MSSFRAPVELAKAYRLLNHGPTVLVSAAHGGQRNIMAAAWAMPLDFAPPKVAVVVDKSTWTRHLLEASGTFALQVPTVSQVDLTEALGSSSGQALAAQQTDKFAAYGLQTFQGDVIDTPLLEGCAAWLECRLLPEASIQQTYDLFLGEVIAAHADTRVFSNGRWHFDGQDALRTIHHVAGGHFIVDGDAVDARPLVPNPSARP
ncbi:flavin reductase family protein [Cupriavidus plantarum]|uniref:Flavin reductase (DIM6/NTAB) family NADH-FMN oxidoreductase RutF n=1 Tax=Cupriavidus plantarum TaxID=942865 RepID=A0A316EXU2_9BURK|nr:flavin reductase family protein [Cupriavidus plantarum]PWK36268.1 flavin reductase (DIM6/NTAB) family NADH-FMN oxidoreductase RutF [Cupriavidus plantarum]